MAAAIFITPALSRYLDACRFLLAIGVAASHVDEFGFSLAWMPFAHLGHDYVVGFFVLSGLVISHSAMGGRKTLSSYVLARASRILSVSVPAVLISLGLYTLGASLKPEALGLTLAAHGLSPIEFVQLLLFMSESWVAGLSLSWNGPYWSICYEVWFYALLALYLYVPQRWRWPVLALAALCAGPKILLLLPCWLLGVALFKSGARWSLTRTQAIGLLVGVLVAATLLVGSGLPRMVQDALRVVPGFWRLDYSQLFVTDFLLGILFSLHLVAVRRLLEGSGEPGWLMTRFAQGARYSFSTYLFHLPLMNFLVLMGLPLDRSAPAAWLFLVLVIGLCMLIGRCTEDQQARVRGWLSAAAARLR